MDLPLFPLHAVLCPGVALPLHVFEDRYKAMVERCLADRTPFGVVLIREGRKWGREIWRWPPWERLPKFVRPRAIRTAGSTC